MNNPTRNKKPPEANLKDCVLSLAEIVESLVGIQQQNARAVRKKERLGRQSLGRRGGQINRAPSLNSTDNTLPNHNTQSKFSQKCPPEMSKTKVIAKNCVRIGEKSSGHTHRRSSQSSVTGSGRHWEEDLNISASDASGTNQPGMRPHSKTKVIAKNCVRICEKSSGHTQKRSSPSSVTGSGRRWEEDLNISASDASGTNQSSIRPHSKKKKPGAINQSRKSRSVKGKSPPPSDLDEYCNSLTRESENEFIPRAGSSAHWQYENEPNALVPGSSNKEGDGSEFYSIEGACVLWDMVERLQCIEEELECLAQRNVKTPSNEGGELTAAHSDESEKSGTDESKHSIMSQTENSETFKNECIDELKEVFAELQVDVPDELWTDPRKSRFFLDIIYDLLDEDEDEDEDEGAQNTTKGGLSNNELNSKKELFTQELGKSLEIKTPQPSAVVKLLELIYLQKGDNEIGRIKTHNITRDKKGRITQNSSIVSGKVDPFRLLVLNSGMSRPSGDNTATKATKEKCDADTMHSEDETNGLIDQYLKGQFTPTRKTTNSKINFQRNSTEYRWCYCPENDKNEYANVSLKSDPDTHELPDIKSEGLLDKEQKIPGDTEGDHKILDLEKQNSHKIETSQESKILETTIKSEQKSHDLQKVTSLIGETPADRTQTEELSRQTLTQDKSTATEMPITEEFNRGEPFGRFPPQITTPTYNPDVIHTPREIDFNAENSLITDSENKVGQGYAMKPSNPDMLHSSREIYVTTENSLISNSKQNLGQGNAMTPTPNPDVLHTPREIDFNAENSLITDSENKVGQGYAMKPSNPVMLHSSREIYVTTENSLISNSKQNLGQGNAMTPTPNPDVLHTPREIDFNAENLLITDSKNKQDEGQSPISDPVPFADIEEELLPSNAKVKIPQEKSRLHVDQGQLPEEIDAGQRRPTEVKIPQEKSRLHMDQEQLPEEIGAGHRRPTEVKIPQEKSRLHMDQEQLSEEIGAGHRRPTKKSSKGKLSLFSCISSPDSKELSSSYVPHSAPNETLHQDAHGTPDSPRYSTLVDQSPLIPEATKYSSPGNTTPELQDQTTAESGVEPQSGTTDQKSSKSLSPLGAPLAESTPIKKADTHAATLGSVNKEAYNDIASAPLPPEEQLLFGSAVPPNPNPQLQPTGSLVGQSNPNVPATSKIDQAGSVGSKPGNGSKGDCPEGYEALDDMIEVTLRGFEKMSNFLHKEPRLTASPSLPDDPNELNKVFASKITEMENNLSAVIKCIQCTLVEMSKVIEKRAGITLPEAHLHDLPKLIELHCSQMFEKSERAKDPDNEAEKDEEEVTRPS